MIINFNKRFLNKKYIEYIEKAYYESLKILKIKCKDLEININFVSKKEIKDLNNRFRNKDSATDVLSFPNLLEVGKMDMQLIVDKLNKKTFASEVNRDNGNIFVGDICICKSIVYKHAREYKNNRLREMVYMAVHGFLHLLGYDHMKDSDKAIMREMEEKIMKKVQLERN